MCKLIKVALLLCFILFSFLSYAQDSLLIKGTIDKILNARTLQIESYHLDSNNITFTLKNQECIIENGEFSFSMPANTVERYFITIKGQSNKLANSSNASFIFEPKSTGIKFLDTLLKNYEIIGNDINKKYESTNKLSNRRLFAQYEVNKNLISLIETEPISSLNAYHLLSICDYIKEEETIRLFNLIPDSVKLNSAGRELRFIIDNLFVGQTAPDFEQLDVNQVKIKLSDFKGKYVLLDFWGSWCIPCRREHPDLIKAFEKYNKKGFEILSFSLDDKKELWLNAIKEDNIENWKNVSDLTGVKNYVSRYIYKVIAVPVNYLIDPTGKIIAKNLKGEELILKLKGLKL